MQLSQTSLGVLIYLAVIAAIAIGIFFVQYTRHVYWYTKAWGESVKFHPILFVRHYVHLVRELRDYGFYRIITGSSARTSKEFFRNRSEGLDIVELFGANSEIITKHLVPCFMQLHEDHSYTDIRLTYLWYMKNEYEQFDMINDHISDVLDIGTTELKRVEILELINSVAACDGHDMEPQIRNTVNAIVAEQAKFFPSDIVERFGSSLKAEGILTQSVGLVMSNNYCRKHFGTGTPDLPFTRDC